MSDPSPQDLALPGLALNQLLKMKAKGLLSLEQFLELTQDLVGTDPERPICFDGTAA